MALIVTIASFVVVAATSVYIWLTMRRRLRDIEETTNLAWAGLRSEIERLYGETQRRFNSVDRAAATARDASQRRTDEIWSDLAGAKARLAELMTLTEFAERAASNGHRRHAFPGSVLVDGADRGAAVEALRTYASTFGAALLTGEENGGPGPRPVRLAYGDGFDRLRERLGLDVEQAVEGPGPINGLLRIVGRQSAGSLQIGPLVVVRADGEFHGALLLGESDMDDCYARRVLDRPEVALAWLRKPPAAYHFDLGPLIGPPPADGSPTDTVVGDGSPADTVAADVLDDEL
jgi:hypothetical protein